VYEREAGIFEALQIHAAELVKASVAEIGSKITPKFEKVKNLEKSTADKVNIMKAKMRIGEAKYSKEATMEITRLKARVKNLERTHD
jgi:polyhydroxyalkanoate synthesis regulator phasin